MVRTKARIANLSKIPLVLKQMRDRVLRRFPYLTIALSPVGFFHLFMLRIYSRRNLLYEKIASKKHIMFILDDLIQKV